MHTITLLRDHTHAGKPHAAGDTLDVDNPTADWLIAQGVGERAAPASKTQPTPPRLAAKNTHGDDHEH